jgi:hypothetical protein
MPSPLLNPLMLLMVFSDQASAIFLFNKWLTAHLNKVTWDAMEVTHMHVSITFKQTELQLGLHIHTLELLENAK